MTHESAKSVLQRMDMVMSAIQQRRRQTLTEICAHTGLPRTTVHRFLEHLVEMRWLSRVGNRYELGIRLLEMAPGSPDDHWFHRLVHPAMLDLQARTKLTVHLTFLDGPEIVIWNKLSGLAGGGIPTRLGARLPAHLTASGKAILAAAAPEALACLADQPLVPHTERSITSFRQLTAAVERTAADGIARDDGEFADGIACLAGSVVAKPGSTTTAGTPMIAAISVSGPRAAIVGARDLEMALRQVCRRTQQAAMVEGHRAYA